MILVSGGPTRTSLPVRPMLLRALHQTFPLRAEVRLEETTMVISACIRNLVIFDRLKVELADYLRGLSLGMLLCLIACHQLSDSIGWPLHLVTCLRWQMLLSE